MTGVLVFVGIVLTTVGVLYFFDIKFCEDKTQAITALTGGLLVFAGSAMALASSSTSFFYKAQQVQTSACELEAETAHPGNRHSDFDKAIYNHIVGCMTNAGYAWLPEYKGCQDAPVATNSLCYLPSGAFARTVTRAQLAFE